MIRFIHIVFMLYTIFMMGYLTRVFPINYDAIAVTYSEKDLMILYMIIAACYGLWLRFGNSSTIKNNDDKDK